MNKRYQVSYGVRSLHPYLKKRVHESASLKDEMLFLLSGTSEEGRVNDENMKTKSQ